MQNARGLIAPVRFRSFELAGAGERIAPRIAVAAIVELVQRKYVPVAQRGHAQMSFGFVGQFAPCGSGRWPIG